MAITVTPTDAPFGSYDTSNGNHHNLGTNRINGIRLRHTPLYCVRIHDGDFRSGASNSAYASKHLEEVAYLGPENLDMPVGRSIHWQSGPSGDLAVGSSQGVYKPYYRMDFCLILTQLHLSGFA